MKAAEAAQKAIETPGLSCEDVEKMIPEYKNPLPRRSWVSSFKKNLPEDLRGRFDDLK